MEILSLSFVGLVLATVIVYYIIPIKVRWLVLLAASCVFYALSGWQGCLWLLLVAAVTFFGSKIQKILIDKEKATGKIERQIKDAEAKKAKEVSGVLEGNAAEENVTLAEDVLPALPSSGWFSSAKKIKTLRKIVLAITIVLPFFAMAFSKYYDVLRGWIQTLPVLTLILPLGLSYFTFQSVGYAIDVYRNKFEPEKNPLKYLLFVSFFPQMTQGPISQYSQLMPQLVRGNRFNPDNFIMGAQLCLWGFFKKMVIADRLTPVTAAISTKEPGWFILLTVIIYLIRLYADFSGGMDVVRGAAIMLGITLPENFKRPFFSHSEAEYWRRWHITLGTWFRSYLYYPLSTSGFGIKLSKIGQKLFGKKAGRALPATVSTIIIFFLIGIWHVANGNAVIYGLYFGLTMGIELLLDPAFKKLKKKLHINEKNFFWKAYTMVRTWVLILIPQYFAFTANPETGWNLLKGTFERWNFVNPAKWFTEIMDPLEWYIAGAAVFVLLVIDIVTEFVNDLNAKLAKCFFVIRWVLIIALILAILVFGCYGTGYDATAFLYTNF